MKMEDLMVGDWIIHPYYKHPSKVLYFCGTKAKVEFEEVSVESLKPVPLTLDILEKNGFIHDYDMDECVADGGHFVTLKGYIYEEDGVLIDYCNGDVRVITDFNGEVTKRMDFVHELQHALRICKINKDIEV